MIKQYLNNRLIVYNRELQPKVRSVTHTVFPERESLFGCYEWESWATWLKYRTDFVEHRATAAHDMKVNSDRLLLSAQVIIAQTSHGLYEPTQGERPAVVAKAPLATNTRERLIGLSMVINKRTKL